MAPHAGVNFDGATNLTNIHIAQVRAGTATWFPEFSPIIEGLCKSVAEALLWLLHSCGLCCAIVDQFPLTWRPNLFHNLNCSVYT